MESTYYYSAVADIQATLNETTMSDGDSEESNDSIGRKTQSDMNRGEMVDSAKSETKTVNNSKINIESSSSAKNSATLNFGDPNFLKDGEVFETDTFDDQYNKNIRRTQHYMEKLLDRMEGSLQRTSRTICKIFSPSQRSTSRTMKGSTEERDKEKDREYADAPDTATSSPMFKLRLGTFRKNTQVQILDRALPGNCILPWQKPYSIDAIVACRTAITTISTLSAVCFCTMVESRVLCEILLAVPRCRPPVTRSRANRYRSERTICYRYY